MEDDKLEEDDGFDTCKNASILSLPALEQRPLPWRPLLAACLGNIAHFYSICSLFSYAGVLSADMQWAVDRDHAGNIAGLLQTANVFGRIPTSSLWGAFAERFGLKCGICIAMGSLSLGNVLFGFCTSSVVLAISIRFLFLGMGSGWVALSGPLFLALGGQERQTEVIGKVFAAGTFVQLVGPAIAGWTYGVFPHFPAAIPGTLGSCISLVSLAAVWKWMAPFEERPDPQQDSSASDTRIIDVIWSTKGFLTLTILRFAQGCMNFAFFEVMPLWAISSVSLGGLSMSEKELGVVLSVSGAGSAMFMAFILSRVTSRFGLRFSITLASSILSMGYLLVPLFPGYVTLTVLHAILNSSYATMGAGYISCINNITPSDRRSTLTGIVVTVESVGKAIGPVASSMSFAGSLSLWGRAGHWVVFSCLAGVHVVLALGTLLLPGATEPASIKCHSSPSAETSSSPPPLPTLVGAKISRRTSANSSDLLVRKAYKKIEAESANLRKNGVEEDEEDAIMDVEGTQTLNDG